MKMKTINYFLIALFCGLFSACMNGDWEAPEDIMEIPPFGNNAIQEVNVISIDSLKKIYNNEINASTDTYKLIDTDIKIKGRVTGNDLGGNIYKQIMVQDETAAIIIGVNQGGVSGYLAEGAEVLIDLKGLYIGGYRKMPQIGVPYNGGIGRMPKDTWDKHFRISTRITTPASIMEPVEFDAAFQKDYAGNCGKLVKITNAGFVNADGKTTYVTGSTVGNAVNQQITINGKSVSTSKAVVRTSTYADFAGELLPKKCTLVGIATRYNNVWQILIRKPADITVLEN